MPFYRGSDVQIISAIVKTIDRHGWYLHNPDLGAPFGQQFYDFPHGGESLQLAAIKALGLFTDRVGLVVNVYFLLGFGVVAAVTFVVLRHLCFSRAIAWAVALLYTFLPYHFAHAEAHLFRSTYYSAPIAALLMLWVLSFRTTFLHSPDAGLRSWRAVHEAVRWPRVGFAALLCVVVAVTETMTVAFTLTALVTACVLVAIRDRSIVQLVVGVLVAGLIVVVFALSLAPNLLFTAEHGSNKVVARRTIGEQEMYGLRLSQMLLPSAHHRLPAARDLTAQDERRLSGLDVRGGAGPGSPRCGGLRRHARERPAPGSPAAAARARRRSRPSSCATAGCSRSSSCSSAPYRASPITLDLLGFTQIRVWNRVVILIAFSRWSRSVWASSAAVDG